MASYGHRAARNILIVLLATFLGSVLGFIFRLVTARSFPREEFGLFYATLALFSLFAVAQNLGLDIALIKRIAELVAANHPHRIRPITIFVLSLQMMCTGVVALTAFFFAPMIATAYLHTSAAADIIRIIAIYFLISPVYTIMLTFLQGLQDMTAYAVWNLARTASSVAALVIGMALLHGSPVTIAAWAFVLGTVVPLPFFFWNATCRHPGPIVSESVTPAQRRSLLMFGASVALTAVASAILMNADTFLLTLLSDLTMVALYNVSTPITQALALFGGVLGIVLLPLSSEMLRKGDVSRLGQGVSRLIKYLLVLLVPVLLIIVVFPEIVLNALFGPGYMAAASILRLLALSSIFYALAAVMVSVLNGAGAPKEVLLVYVIAASANVVLNLLFIPLFGALGAALAALCSSALMFLLVALRLRRRVPFEFRLLPMIGVCIAAVGCVLLFSLLKGWIVTNPLIELLVISVPCVVMYILLLLLFSVINKEDVILLRTTVHTVLRGPLRR